MEDNQDSMEKPSVGVLFGVSLTTDKLTTQELATLALAASHDSFAFENLPFYEKIKPLFVGGDTMHKDVKEAIIILAGRRLAKMENDEQTKEG
jgi:hypothetical protein